MIYLLHTNRYWTEYLDSLLEDQDHFSIIRSTTCKDPSYLNIPLKPFNPKLHKVILSAGHVYDDTDGNLIICRYHHSPGFNIHPMIEGYFRLIANHPTSDFRYILLKEHYRLLMITDNLPPKHDYIRSKMIQDPRVSTSSVDTMLFKIQQAPAAGKRQPATGLIAPNWLIAKENPKRLLDVYKTLCKQMKLTFVLHPLTVKMSGLKNFPNTVAEIFGSENVLFNQSRNQMIHLYDTHEYILSDGSGSLYEAMIRGCKPLLIDQLSYQQNNREFHPASAEGYLKVPAYHNPQQANAFDSKAFLLQLFPYLYALNESETKNILKKEILKCIE